MQYISKNDLYRVISQQELDDLTEGSDILITETEGTAIEEAIGYLNTRFDTEKIFTSTKNSLLVMYLCDVTLYHLFSRVAPDHIPELRDTRYKSAINWFEKIADGFISPNLPTKSKSEKMPIRFGGSQTKQNHYY